MAKAKKVTNGPKLYHGTTELVAKASCGMKGFSPYDSGFNSSGIPKTIYASSGNAICLTDTYAGLMSFDTSNPRDRWGIIEIDVAYLSQYAISPHEIFLMEKGKTKLTSEDDRLKKTIQLRSSLLGNRKLWRESLESCGFCVYDEHIPLEGITKVSIYDPASNPIMTKAMTSVLGGGKFHKSNQHRHKMLTRWLMGENITPEDWVGTEELETMKFADKDRIAQFLRNKHGLDIFYTGGANGKKASWW